MKILKNKKTAIPFDEKVRNTTYAQLISICCDKIPQGGFTTSVMRGRIKIQDVCKKATSEIKLEDADAAAVVQLVKVATWNFKHKDLIDFEDDVIKEFS